MSSDIDTNPEGTRLHIEKLIVDLENYKADAKRFELQYVEMAGLREKEQWRADKAACKDCGRQWISDDGGAVGCSDDVAGC